MAKIQNLDSFGGCTSTAPL